MSHSLQRPTLSHEVLERFRSLVCIPAPSSREHQIAATICEQLQAMGLQPERDAGGNVMVEVPGRDPELPLWCYAAHMDEISMVVTRIRPSGDLEVARSGSLYPWKLGEGPVEILGDKESVVGIFSMGSMHIPLSERKPVGWEGVWITTGMTETELAEAGVRPGSLAVLHASRRGPYLFGSPDNPMVAAWSFDDRMACALLLELLAYMQATGEQPLHPSLFAFTHNEEVGGWGMKNLARMKAPETIIALDLAPTPPGTPLQMDDRPAIWSKDSHGHYDHGLILELLAAGREVDVDLQTVVYERAASDASIAYTAGLTERALCFGWVCGNSHGFETMRLGALRNIMLTLHRFVTTR